MRLSWLMSATLMLSACPGSGPDGDDEWVSSDIRIDGAGEGDTSVDSIGARMCAASNGNVYAVWYDDREGSNDIWFQLSRDGGRTWTGEPAVVNSGEGDATNPDIACVGNTVYVTWEDTRDGEIENKNIYFNRSDSAGTRWFEEDVLIDGDVDGKSMSIGPRIVSAGDEVHIAWSDAVNGAYDIYVASSTNLGSSFAAPVRADSDTPGSAFSAFPQILADGQGTVMVAWEDSRDELNDIYFARSTDSGASFGDDVRLDVGDDPGSADSFAPRMAASGDHVYVVWHDERNGSRDVLMNVSTNGGASWQAAALPVESEYTTSDGTNTPGSADSLYPEIVMTGTTAHVVWQDRRSGGYDIYYRSFVDGSPRAISHERETQQGDVEDAAGEIRLDLGLRPGFANAVRARIAALENDLVVAWEDRRDDGTQGTPAGYNDIYYSFSDDGGDTFALNSIRMDSYAAGIKYSVDLQLDVNDDNELLCLWQDGRRGNTDVFFTNLPIGDRGTAAPADIVPEQSEEDAQ